MRGFVAAGALAAWLGLAGCAGITGTEDTQGGPTLRLADVVPVSGAPADPATITAASIQGDVLVLEVRFGGGCREHAFDLYAQTAFMESEPVQTRLALAHEANDDRCRALLSRELRFDLGPLREAYRRGYNGYGSGNRIVLHLLEPGGSAAAGSPLTYSF